MNLSDSVFRIKKFAEYKLKAGDAHGLHSPFVYDLYTNVIQSAIPYYAYASVEALRARMLLSNKKIAVEDFGTGNRNGEKRQLSLQFIASHYVKPRKYGQLLFRLVNHFRPNHILEIGTSLGITTLYLALPEKTNKVTTLEGSAETAAVAEENFRKMGVENIEVIKGEFSQTLPSALQSLPSADFVYFDGNHRREPTLNYFRQCLQKRSEHSLFVFDDIYWSREMAEAWEEIKNDPAVTLTVDLYSIGLVFFKEGIPKQHFKLEF